MTVRTYAQQKAGLTRQLTKYRKAKEEPNHILRETALGDARQDVVDECRRTVAEWESAEWAAAHRVRQGAWPDDWARWQRALSDCHTQTFVDLDQLRP